MGRESLPSKELITYDVSPLFVESVVEEVREHLTANFDRLGIKLRDGGHYFSTYVGNADELVAVAYTDMYPKDNKHGFPMIRFITNRIVTDAIDHTRYISTADYLVSPCTTFAAKQESTLQYNERGGILHSPNDGPVIIRKGDEIRLRTGRQYATTNSPSELSSLNMRALHGLDSALSLIMPYTEEPFGEIVIALAQERPD